jgi:hypothetical protein
MTAEKVRNLCLVLLIAVFSSLVWVPAHAQEMTCPEHTPVVIDIKPGSYPNSINLSANGLLPVAVVATPDFDASLFQPEMAHLSDANTAMDEVCSGAMPVRWLISDVNKDGKADLVFFFNIQDLDLTPASTAAVFMAHGSYGGATLHIMGTDTVKVVSK